MIKKILKKPFERRIDGDRWYNLMDITFFILIM